MIQIHLMFLFIRQNKQNSYTKKEIQIHLMFLFIPNAAIFFVVQKKFKYISCSYLSNSLAYQFNFSFPFKYISCSYLSDNIYIIRYNDSFIQIHLMFLFILLIPFLLTLKLLHSNTSHVLIYLPEDL